MFKKTLILLLIWKELLLFTTIITQKLIPFGGQVSAQKLFVGTPNLIWPWGNFDGIHYLTTANIGYTWPNTAFFPLFPIAIHIVHKMFLVPWIESGMIVSHTALFLSLFFIYKITRLDFDKETAFRAIVFILFFPTAFFYTAVYADSLYLLLSTVSFYFARKSSWLWAGMFGFFAGAARLVGIILLPILLLEWYFAARKQKGTIKELLRQFIKSRAYFLFLIPLGVISYGAYLQATFGDFFLFQKAMAIWNQGEFVTPLHTLARYIKIFLNVGPSYVYFVAWVEFIATLTYFALSIYVLKRVRFSYGLFMLLTLLTPTFTGTLQSMPRYILHLFPAFIGLAVLCKSKKLFWPVAIFLLLLQLLFVTLFTRGYFIA